MGLNGCESESEKESERGFVGGGDKLIFFCFHSISRGEDKSSSFIIQMAEWQIPPLSCTADNELLLPMMMRYGRALLCTHHIAFDVHME
jgi:hypothetical protein